MTVLQSPCVHSSPPVLSDIPAYLHRWHGDSTKRKHKKRGRRGCTAIKRELLWKAVRVWQPCLHQLTGGHSHADPVRLAKVLCYPTTYTTLRDPAVYIPSKSNVRGVNFYNLSSLCQEPVQINQVPSIYLALINTRSLVNKTFIINDFFFSHELDILCVTETWLNEGNISVLSELMQNYCSYINTPHLLGEGEDCWPYSVRNLTFVLCHQMFIIALNCNCFL